MRFRTYILLSAATFWLILGSLFMYRSLWNIKSFRYKTGPVTEYSVKYLDSAHYEKFLGFKIVESNKTFGLKNSKKHRIDTLMKYFNIGDTIQMYYSDWRHTKNDVYFQIEDLKVGNQYLISLKMKQKRDRLIAFILYFIALILFLLAWWLNRDDLRKRIFKKKSENEQLIDQLLGL